MYHKLRPDFASYSYTVIGFPKVVLKWSENGLAVEDCYVTVKGLIQGNFFYWQRDGYGGVDFRNEIPRFEKLVREKYCDDITMQG